MKRQLFAILLLAIALPCSVYAGKQDGRAVGKSAVTVAPPATTAASATQGAGLTQDEIDALVSSQTRTPGLQGMKGAGCETVWNNDKQQNETVCGDPVRYGIICGAVGALFGSLGGVGGAVAGGVIGFGVGYAISP